MNDPDWLELAKFLGGHPLACTIAGYSCGSGALFPGELLKQLTTLGLGVLDDNDPTGTAKHDSRDSLTILFRRTAEALSPAARLAWSALTFAGSNPTPTHFLNALGVTDTGALRELVLFALAKTSRETSPETGDEEPAYALAHSLLGEWGRTALADYGIKRDEVLVKAMVWAIEYWEKFDKRPQDHCRPAQYAIVAPIADAILREVEPNTDMSADVLETFLYLPARMHQHHGQFALAEPILRRCGERMKEVAGESSPKYATAISNLAGLLQDTNRLAEAELLKKRALAIAEQSHGPSHPTVAGALNNLAQLLQATNRLSEAEPLMKRVLNIAEQNYGTSHDKVAIALNNLAQLLKATNRLAEAEPLMRRAAIIFLQFRAQTGHQHPHLLYALCSYRVLCKKMKVPVNGIEARLFGMCREEGMDDEAAKKILASTFQ